MNKVRHKRRCPTVKRRAGFCLRSKSRTLNLEYQCMVKILPDLDVTKSQAELFTLWNSSDFFFREARILFPQCLPTFCFQSPGDDGYRKLELKLMLQCGPLQSVSDNQFQGSLFTLMVSG